MSDFEFANGFKKPIFPIVLTELWLTESQALEILSEVKSKESQMQLISEKNIPQTCLSKTEDYYVTDFGENVPINKFEKYVIEPLYRYFDNHYNVSVKNYNYFTAIYGERATHKTHHHSLNMFDNINMSGILYLSNIGGTILYNPLQSSTGNREHIEESKLGKIVMFPSSVLHYVLPHEQSKEYRYVMPFNLEVTFKR